MLRALVTSILLLTISGLAHAQPGDQTLNFRDADIREFITAVSDITGKSFIVDPRVEGKVNVISAKPMAPDEVYAVFESVLRVNGLAAVPSGKMIKIVPEAMAKADGDGSGNGIGPDSLVTRVIELKHVSAQELLPILTQLVPQSGQVSVHQASNSLILTDRSGNLGRIESIIRRIDQASDAAIEIIPLQHANATDMARTLTLLAEDKAAAATGGGVRVLADGRTNSILLSGDRGARLRLRTMVSHLDTPLESGDSTQVVYVNNAKASDLVSILEQTAATLTEQSGAKDAPKAATIQAHEETNALIITADPAVFRVLQGVIRQLDVRRAQVLIEAVIAEVSDDFAEELGVQWQIPPNGLDDNTFIGGTSFTNSTGSGSITQVAQNPLALGNGLSLGYITGTTRIPGTDTEILNLGVLARAIKSDGRSNLLSNPSVVTLDNAEAVIKVGQEVPFLTGQYTNTGSGGSSQPTNPFQTIERKDVGLQLTVTPHVNEGDAVRLELKQEVSSLAQPVTGASDLITNKREITTNVMISDGQMLVLGGLISDEVKENIAKVPALGDIPVVGNLFRYRSTQHTKRNLMIFLRPRILRDAATENAASSEKYSFIRARQLEARERDGYLRPDTSQPLLPEQAWTTPMRVPEAPAAEGGH